MVEDERAISDLLRLYLSREGFGVLVATDGLSALDRLGRIVPDIILLDAVMPGIDGFETCRRIKQMDNVRHVPVMFMTGLTETEHVLQGFDAGGMDYVTKPIEPTEVLARVATHIRNARMMAQARHAIDAVSHAAISVNADGTPLWQTRQAADWLTKYFSSDSLPKDQLPTIVAEWLKAELAKEGDHLPLHAKSAGLELHLTLARRQRELLILLEEKSEEGTASLDHYQLTPRELDVLLWVAKGKTNRDIAEILGMSPRTVNKHLEHIYVKLGVETRSAAAALVAGKTNLT